MKINLLNYNLSQLKSLFEELGEKPFRAQQILKWVHQNGMTDFNEMTNLSKILREKLIEIAEVRAPDIVTEQVASDGVIKWLMKMDDSNAIETVYIPDRDRATLCISSQIGCALNCSFCSTGKEGFNRNLQTAEIIGQVWRANQRIGSDEFGDVPKITNVVMMGMGEPLLNYEPVITSMDIMMDDLAYGLSKYKVTLSTSGVVPAMEKLKQDSICALAVSLHAPTDDVREQLVPLNKKYPLKVLMETCRNYYGPESKRHIMFEYVMLKDINDQPEQARKLIKLLKGINCKVNLIPFNPFPKSNYVCSSRPVIEEFQEVLMRGGLNALIRRTRGEDIDGACGQLAGKIKDRTGRNARWQKTGRLVPSRD